MKRSHSYAVLILTTLSLSGVWGSDSIVGNYRFRTPSGRSEVTARIRQDYTHQYIIDVATLTNFNGRVLTFGYMWGPLNGNYWWAEAENPSFASVSWSHINPFGQLERLDDEARGHESLSLTFGPSGRVVLVVHDLVLSFDAVRQATDWRTLNSHRRLVWVNQVQDLEFLGEKTN